MENYNEGPNPDTEPVTTSSGDNDTATPSEPGSSSSATVAAAPSSKNSVLVNPRQVINNNVYGLKL